MVESSDRWPYVSISYHVLSWFRRFRFLDTDKTPQSRTKVVVELVVDQNVQSVGQHVEVLDQVGYQVANVDGHAIAVVIFWRFEVIEKELAQRLRQPTKRVDAKID